MILRYKVTIPGNRIFMREYDFDSGMSLFRLHEFLDRDMCFSPDQMTMFETVSEKGKVRRRLGLFDFGDGSMDMVSLADTVEHGEPVLRYVYNMSINLFMELSLESETEFNPRLSYPLLVAEKGRNPGQFSAVYEEYEAFSDRHAVQADDAVEEDAFEDEDLPEGEETV